MLVCMKRLEVKEQDTYNFYSVMTEYKSIHDSSQTSDNGCAFEHLLQRHLISFTDNKGHNQSVEFRSVKLLVSSAELHQGLKSCHQCPVSYSHHNLFLCIIWTVCAVTVLRAAGTHLGNPYLCILASASATLYSVMH
ncbi:hypothetical protein V6N11_045781 [Hibiscus sabdariffa]|uniref:Origin recognition complex subunit 4 C-terminal domain-containing protein n=1 Tax=Hibiscus sabdariffa TaxID=183260 RepID=A0ABR2Q204_9ROSI